MKFYKNGSLALADIITPEQRLEELLATDPGGVDNMATTADDYEYAPAAGKVAVIERLNVYIEDNAKFTAITYGAIPLTVGITVWVESGAAEAKMLTPLPVTKIGHWGLVTGRDAYLTEFSTGVNQMAQVRWTFSFGGGPILLDGDDADKLIMTTGDDMTALVAHYAQVQGALFDLPARP